MSERRFRTEIVPAFAAGRDGQMFRRGSRIHCDCGHLSVVMSYRDAKQGAHIHRLEHLPQTNGTVRR